MKSPFKFLDSYTKEDQHIFFGRDKEIEELYSRVFESKILLVYGISGTGKTSLLNCGLANKFSDADWLPINIRRGNNINQSLMEGLEKFAISKTLFEKNNKDGNKKITLNRALQSIYLDHFKPVYLIFDQFEELFIFGTKNEKDELIRSISKVIDSEIQCKFIFSIREEYLAGVTEFEKVISTFLENRIRIEKMTRQNAIQAIEGPCRVNNIEVEKGFADALLDKLNPESPDVELTFLQVFLDKIFRSTTSTDQSQKISNDILNKLGDVKDLLGSFLEEQISQLEDPGTAMVVLKSFVSSKGTKNQITESEVIDYSKTIGKDIEPNKIKNYIQIFIRLRILRDKDDNSKYELCHDSLAAKIFEKISLLEKELLEIRLFIDHAFNNFEKRKVLLTTDDLKYIAPYEDKLFLNEKIIRFVVLSKREIQKTKQGRQNILIVTASTIIIVLAIFSTWALRERRFSIRQQMLAEEQKNEAFKAKEEADSARQDAIHSKQQAQQNEKLALTAKHFSEQAKEEALQEKKKAEELSLIAKQESQNAQREKKLADQQKEKAEKAEEKTKQLNMLSISQNLALKSVLLDKNPELMGLLAIQAYVFNQTNGGNPDDPIIYNALKEAFLTIDNSKHSVFTGSENECRAIAETNNGLLSIDLDGQMRLWDQDGKNTATEKLDFQQMVDLTGINPSGTYLTTTDDNFTLRLWTINPQGTSDKSVELKGHRNMIRSLAYSANEEYLASGGMDSLIIIWNIKATEPSSVVVLKTPSVVKGIVFCGTDSIVATLNNGSMLIWNIQQPDGKLFYASTTEKPLCLAYNNKTNTLLAGCSNGVILAFNLRKKDFSPVQFAVHAAGIDQIKFNDDCSLLATSCWDKSIKFYYYAIFSEHPNAAKGIIELKNLNSRARTLLFTKDNRLVATMADKSIRIWETSSLKLKSMVCDRVKRDMNTMEWNDMIGDEIPYQKGCGNNQSTR